MIIRRWSNVAVLLAALLPPLLFPKAVLQAQSFYFYDLAWIHYPLRSYIADLWKSGTWPLWNPYSWNGFPLLAESEVGALSPVNALFFLPLPTYQSFNLLILLHTVVAGLSAYALARQTRVRQGSALIAALSYACGGYIMGQLLNLNIMIGSAWAPLILALALSAWERRRARDAMLAGLVLALQIYSSHPQVPYYTLILLGIFAIYGVLRGWQIDERKTWHAFIQSAGYLAITLFIGLGLSAPQWVTGLELLALSRRAQGLAMEAQLSYSMPPISLLALIFPRLFVSQVESFRSTGAFLEFHFYLGLIPLVCAALAMLRRHELIVRFAFVLALIAFILALGRFTPVYRIVSHLPLLSSFRVPSRWLFVAAVAFIILVGKGSDAIYELMQNASRRPSLKRIVISLTILYVFLLLIVPFALIARTTIAESFQAREAFSIERIAAGRLLPEAISFSVLGGLCLVALWGLAWWRPSLRAFAVVMVAITFGDLFFAGGGLTTAPSFWEQGRPLAEFVRANGPYDRIFSTGGYLDVVPRLGDAQPAGARVFASSGENDLPLGLQRTEDFLKELPFLQGLRLRGTHWLVIPKAVPPQGNRHLAIAQSIIPQLQKAWETDQVNVYAIPNPLSHTYVVYDVMPATSKAHALELMRDAQFDPKHTAVVEDVPLALPHDPNLSSTPAAIMQYEATSLRIETEAVSNGLLVLTDTYYPGWRAWVDGAEQPIWRTNYLFRGIMLPTGRHTIEFRYEPISFQIGLLIAAVTIGLTLFAGTWYQFFGSARRKTLSRIH